VQFVIFRSFSVATPPAPGKFPADALERVIKNHSMLGSCDTLKMKSANNYSFPLSNKINYGQPMLYRFVFTTSKEMQHIIFYAHVHACSPSYTDEERKTF